MKECEFYGKSSCRKSRIDDIRSSAVFMYIYEFVSGHRFFTCSAAARGLLESHLPTGELIEAFGEYAGVAWDAIRWLGNMAKEIGISGVGLEVKVENQIKTKS